MSEEEKEAIETVKQYKKCFIFETVHEETGERLNDYSNAIEIVLSLIKRQQQEIEDMREELQMYVDTDLIKEKLEKEIKSLLKEIEGLKERQDYARLEKEQLLEDSISKDKIRKIIYGNYEDLEIILLIKELLEE